MALQSIGPLLLQVEIQRWPLAAPFRITGHTYEFVDVLVVDLECGGKNGYGEARGVPYHNETVHSMLQQIEVLRSRIERGLDRESLQNLLRPGGVRNALDCAFWDLEAKLTGRCVWQLAELERPRPVQALLTCGADDPRAMAATARAYTHARALKLKLTGEPIDEDRVRAVREARPDVWLSVDANQGFTRPFLERLMPVLIDTRVTLIEQPFAIGQESLLDGFESPIAIAADESVQCLSDLPRIADRFDMINIKLDKCGGLTEGLAMARCARQLGLEAWAGSMLSTSLAMAPSFLVGQLCSMAELDGPLFLKADRAEPIQYTGAGLVTCPETLWGAAQ